MGIFDFLKKNKNIENDNGLNEIYLNGKLWKRFYKKNGKDHGRSEHYLFERLCTLSIYDNGLLVGNETFTEDGWVKEKKEGNLNFWYSDANTLMTYDEVLRKILEKRETEENLRLTAELANKKFRQLGESFESAIIDIDKHIKSNIESRIKEEGVFFINDFAFVDDDYPNPYIWFTGKHDNIEYAKGKKRV